MGGASSRRTAAWWPAGSNMQATSSATSRPLGGGRDAVAIDVHEPQLLQPAELIGPLDERRAAVARAEQRQVEGRRVLEREHDIAAPALTRVERSRTPDRDLAPPQPARIGAEAELVEVLRSV